jgi:hypothetical protein
MCPRPGLDTCGKSRPHRDSIPGPSSPLPVGIPSTLPSPLYTVYTIQNVHNNSDDLVHHLSLYHVLLANQHTITDVALCHNKFEDPWLTQRWGAL